MYLDPTNMSESDRNKLIEWIKNEGLDPSKIVNDGTFSAHKGRVAGNEFILGESGRPLFDFQDNAWRTKHFNVRQHNPLPEWDEV